MADGAITYLRIAAIAAPAFMLASAGQGYLRGTGDLRTPLVILVVAHVVNIVLEVLFVYGFDWGLAGSAWGTVIAQAGHGRRVLRRPAPRRLAAPRPRAHAPADARRTGDRRPHDRAARRVPRRLGRARARRRRARSPRTRSPSSSSSSSRWCSTRSRSPRRCSSGGASARATRPRAREAAGRTILWSVVLGAVFGLVLVAVARPAARPVHPGRRRRRRRRTRSGGCSRR